MSGSPTDALLESSCRRIDAQATLTSNQALAVSPMSPEAETVDKAAQSMMYRNGLIKGLMIAKGIVGEEYERIMKPQKTAVERGAARAPYGRNRAAKKQGEQNG